MAHSDRWRTMIGGWEAGGMGGEAQNSVPGKEFSSWHTELSPGDIELRPRGTEFNPGGTEMSAKARNMVETMVFRALQVGATHSNGQTVERAGASYARFVVYYILD